MDGEPCKPLDVMRNWVEAENHGSAVVRWQDCGPHLSWLRSPHASSIRPPGGLERHIRCRISVGVMVRASHCSWSFRQCSQGWSFTWSSHQAHSRQESLLGYQLLRTPLVLLPSQSPAHKPGDSSGLEETIPFSSFRFLLI